MLDRRWLPLNALRAFEAAAKHSSFTLGAQALQVTQSALSRHVAGLEGLLNCKLVDRKPHGLVLTAAGASLLPAVTRSFDRIETVLNEIQREGSGFARTLRVHMPPSFLQEVGLPILRDFRHAFPAIPIDVSSSAVTGVPARDLDVAVVYDRPRQEEAVRDLLWTVRVTPLCSPSLVKAGQPRSLAGFLAAHDLLHVKLEGQPRGVLWNDFATRADITLETEGGLAFDTASLAISYALAGQGVVLADIRMFAELVDQGRLVQPFDAVHEDGFGYYLTFHPDDLDEPGVSLFRTWMIERCSGKGFHKGRGT